MKYKLIIRKIQLYKLGYGNKPKELEVLERMKGLTEKGGFYYNSDGDKILFYIVNGIKNNSKLYAGAKMVYINYRKIWRILKSEFKMSKNDTKLLTKWYIESNYNLEDIFTSGGPHCPI